MIRRFTFEAHSGAELMHPKQNERMRLLSHPNAILVHELQEAELVPVQLFDCFFLDYLHFGSSRG